MRHLTFYFAIGFVIMGCVMLCIGFSSFVSRVLNNSDRFDTAVLGTAMSLPFIISALSWRDWREIQKKEHTHQESPETLVSVEKT